MFENKIERPPRHQHHYERQVAIRVKTNTMSATSGDNLDLPSTGPVNEQINGVQSCHCGEDHTHDEAVPDDKGNYENTEAIEWFDRKFPDASCSVCEKKLCGRTTVECGGGGGACETWFCGHCHNSREEESCACCREDNEESLGDDENGDK